MERATGVTSHSPLPSTFRLTQRTWLVPFLIAGVACIVGGGLLAAATAYVTTQKTAWATAYLVLVGGIAQAGLGAAVAGLSPLASRRLAWTVLIGWNIGNAGVLAGQLSGLVALTDVGGAVLVVSLVLVLIAVRSGRRADIVLSPTHPGVLWAFRVLVLVLAVTIPIGLTLAHLGG